MSNKITLKKMTGKSKRTGEDFTAYELKAGLYSTLIFPRTKVEAAYLDKFLKDEAHSDFKDGGYLDDSLAED